MISSITRHFVRLPSNLYQAALDLLSRSPPTPNGAQIYIAPEQDSPMIAAMAELYHQTQSESLCYAILSHIEKHGLATHSTSRFGWKMLITVGSPMTLSYAITQHDLLFERTPETTSLCARDFLAQTNIWEIIENRLNDSPSKHETLHRIIGILEGFGLERPQSGLGRTTGYHRPCLQNCCLREDQDPLNHHQQSENRQSKTGL